MPPIFVIQKHDASTLHYDLRLEINGVLKSWALPKTPPTEAGIKRLEIRTEDHPMEYADFEGVIPQGQYGAGNVKIWDRGEARILKRTEREIVFVLEGERLRGAYVLIKAGFGNWLFFKKKE